MKITLIRKNFYRALTFLILIFLAQAGAGFKNAVAAEDSLGKVISVIIDKEGWNMTVALEGFKSKGTYFLDSESSPKVKVKVFSEGFDINGNPIVVERLLVATKVLRKIYPQDDEFDETNTGAGLIVKLALNKPIYNDDKQGGSDSSGHNPIISFSPGWYQDTGPDGTDLDALETVVTATNESELDYPKVIGNWALPGWEIVRESIDLEAVFYHSYARDQKPVALVEFDLTDASGNEATTKLVKEMTISGRNDLNKVLVYAASMGVDALNTDEIVTARFKAYPWIGDQDSILDSDLGAEKPSPLYGPFYFFNDKAKNFGQATAYVDENGDDSLAVVTNYNDRVNAKNNPFKTIASAISAIAKFNELDFGRADPSGAIVYLNNGVHNWISGNTVPGNFTTGNTYLTITKSEDADKASVILSSTGTNNFLKVPFVKIQDLTISRVLANDTGTMFRGSEELVLWIDQCAIEGLGHRGPTFYQYGNVYFTNNTINNAKSIFEFSVTKQISSLLRSNRIDRSGTLHPYVLLGNNIIDTRVMRDDKNPNIPTFDNTIIAYNQFLDLSTYTFSFAANSNIEHGFALVQNVFERSELGLSPLLQVAGDNSLTTTNHVLMWHNTLVGERSNIFYNDVGVQPYRQQNMSVVGNIMNEFNIKSDTFNHPDVGPNAQRTGNWEALYGSGYYGNLSHTGATSDAFQHEFFGHSSKWNIDPLFIQDASSDTGDHSGNGDYGLLSYSPADRLMNHNQVLPYDLKGIVRLNDCRGAAGAFEDDSVAVFCVKPQEITSTHQGLLLSWRFPTESSSTNHKVFRLGSDEALATTVDNYFLDAQINVLQDQDIIEYIVEAYNDEGDKVGQVHKKFDPKGNIVPQALAGLDQGIEDKDLNGSEVVFLDGSGSIDFDGEIVAYEWIEEGKIIATDAMPQISMSIGSHSVILKVIDDNGEASTDTVEIIINEPLEELEAKAGDDQIISDIDNNGVETVLFDGSASIDRDGAIATYQWFEEDTLLATGVQASVSLPLGVHNITLQITDDSGKTATDEVIIKIKATNLPLLSLISDQEIYDDGSKKWVGQASARVGGALSAQDAAFVMVFKLPELDEGEEVKEATLNINLLNIANNPEGKLDLYGLGYRESSVVLASDYYQGEFGADLTNAMPIQDDFVTQASVEGWQSVNTTNQTNLVSYINAQYQAGAKGGDYIFVRLNSDIEDVSSYRYWEFATADSDQSPELTVKTGHADLTIPTAHAGSDQIIADTANDGIETVLLDGSGSTDNDGTITDYKWFEEDTLLVTGIQGNVVLSVGIHNIILEVTDDSGKTATDVVAITIEPEIDTSLLQANAGIDQTIADVDNDGVETVLLDGSESTNNDGTITSYQWFEEGTLLATGMQESVALSVGTHNITLEVTDGNGKTATDEVIVTVKTETLSILGEITDQEVYEAGNKKWVGQAAARVGGALSAQDAVFILVFKLPELEENEEINSATLDVNLLNIANNPEGNIDVYGLGYRDNSVVLASDYYQGVFGADLTNSVPIQDDFVTQASIKGWQSIGATSQLNLVNYINAQYQAGAKGGDYIFIRLNPDIADVNSYHYWEFATANSDQVPVLTVNTDNTDLTIPIANAGPDQTITDAGNDDVETVLLDGSGSTDVDGIITDYKWFEVDTLLGLGSQESIDLSVGIHRITLEVTDDSGKIAIDEVTITIEPEVDQSLLQAKAGIDQIIADVDNDGVETILLDGSESTNSDGIISDYKWFEENTLLATGMQKNIVLTVGTHNIILEITDDSGKIAIDEVTITIEPEVDQSLLQAKAGIDQTIVDTDNDGVGTVLLNGSGSIDNDGTITEYKWFEAGTLLATGVQESVVLAVGAHNITLEVTDNSGKTATDEITITIEANVATLSILAEISDQEVYEAGSKKWVGQSSARVGGALSLEDSVFVLVFKLPELGEGEEIKTASLDINLLNKANSPEGNIDLYGLGFRENSVVLASDYFQGVYADDFTDATPLQDDFVTQSNIDGFQSTNNTGQSNLVNYINAQYLAGAEGGDYIFIRLNPDIADVSSYHYWEFSTANSDQVPVLSIFLGNID